MELIQAAENQYCQSKKGKKDNKQYNDFVDDRFILFFMHVHGLKSSLIAYWKKTDIKIDICLLNAMLP